MRPARAAEPIALQNARCSPHPRFQSQTAGTVGGARRVVRGGRLRRPRKRKGHKGRNWPPALPPPVPRWCWWWGGCQRTTIATAGPRRRARDEQARDEGPMTHFRTAAPPRTFGGDRLASRHLSRQTLRWWDAITCNEKARPGCLLERSCPSSRCYCSSGPFKTTAAAGASGDRDRPPGTAGRSFMRRVIQARRWKAAIPIRH
jgi:hypothetical protein